MVIGFSCGVFHKLQNNSNERFSEKSMQQFYDAGANAIELMCHTIEHLTYLSMGNYKYIDRFDHVSIHAPAVSYDDNLVSHELLQQIESLCKIFAIKSVVFHPDTVKNWNVINTYSAIPVAIENMDERKKSFRTRDDVKRLLDKYPFGLVIDLQHCFANDPVMQLARDLHASFYDRIVGYHISGYDVELLHVPLCERTQDVIISELQRKDVPIIIESTFDAYGDADLEMRYILERL